MNKLYCHTTFWRANELCNDGTISESIGCITSVLVEALSRVKLYPEILSQELKTCAAVKCTAGLVFEQ